MNLKSHFYQLARTIKVSDICTPFLASFESIRLVSNVNEEWVIDLCYEKDLDPMEQISLVQKENKVIGWIGFDMLEVGKTINECMDPIKPDSIISSNTSLFDAVAAFAKSSIHFFLVLKGNQFIGWLSYRDLHKPPLRLCLFAMLINIEKMLLDIITEKPGESIKKLSSGRFEKAKSVYKMRKYNFKEDDVYFNSKLLECTNMIDKFTISRHTPSIFKRVNALNNESLCKTAEILRNEIAHPGINEQSSNLLSQDNLWSFIQWAETLEEQLQDYLDYEKNSKSV